MQRPKKSDTALVCWRGALVKLQPQARIITDEMAAPMRVRRFARLTVDELVGRPMSERGTVQPASRR